MKHQGYDAASGLWNYHAHLHSVSPDLETRRLLFSLAESLPPFNSMGDLSEKGVEPMIVGCPPQNLKKKASHFISWTSLSSDTEIWYWYHQKNINKTEVGLVCNPPNHPKPKTTFKQIQLGFFFGIRRVISPILLLSIMTSGFNASPLASTFCAWLIVWAANLHQASTFCHEDPNTSPLLVCSLRAPGITARRFETLIMSSWSSKRPLSLSPSPSSQS